MTNMKIKELADIFNTISNENTKVTFKLTDKIELKIKSMFITKEEVLIELDQNFESHKSSPPPLIEENSI